MIAGAETQLRVFHPELRLFDLTSLFSGEFPIEFSSFFPILDRSLIFVVFDDYYEIRYLLIENYIELW
ncbi:hypothetical protein F0562_030107 [Nyssa sinensis]|uniref:Uncharacterized protein n=1 Tax=Nyssa sinensis TaxID=561372 RepID=A0A5J5AXJ8_9ASTE|nr:hypothetical protein F0562_030107 [Nyssa sinensis]